MTAALFIVAYLVTFVVVHWLGFKCGVKWMLQHMSKDELDRLYRRAQLETEKLK